MASDDTWNLQNLPPEAREAAREAARRRGVPFEQWVQSAILDSARAGSGGPSESRAGTRWREAEAPRRRRDDPAGAVHAMHGRVDDLRGELERMTRHASDTAIPPRPTDSGRELAAALQLIEEQLAEFDTEMHAHPHAGASGQVHSGLANDEGETASEFERRIAAVDQALNSLNPGPAPAHSSTEPDAQDEFTHGLDRAVADIRERQRILDAAENANPLKRQFAGLSQRLAASAPRAAAAPSSGTAEVREQLRQITEELRSWRRSGSLQDALAVLREELSEIGSKLGEAAPRRALEALEAEVHTLAARLDDNRVHGVDSSILTGLEQGLAEVRDSLRKYAPAEALAAFRDEVRALDRKLEWVEANADGDSLQQLQRSVAELREVATHAASGDAVIALAEEVQRISDRLDHVTDPALGSELLSNLDRRFEALAADLGARADSTPVSTADAAGNLVTIVEALAAKLEHLELGQESSVALEAISSQLERLTDRIGSTDARLDHLEQMDRTFSELLDRVDNLRAEAVAAAERTAHDVAMQVVREYSGFDGTTLRHDIDSLRETQSRSDRHTQDTLEVVHDTLERLIDRLAAVETDLRAPLVPASPGSPAEHAHGPAVAPTEDSDWPPELETLTAPPAAEPPHRQTTAPPITVERRPIDPSLPADHPLEPGAVRQGRSPASAAERIAASEAALGPAKPAKEPDARANFIAAARRAAQAAANMSPPSETEPAPNAEQPAPVSLLRRLTGRRMLLVALAVLVAAGGVRVVRSVPSLDMAPMRAWVRTHVEHPLAALIEPAATKTEVAMQAPADEVVNAAASDRQADPDSDTDKDAVLSQPASQAASAKDAASPSGPAAAAKAAPATAGVSPFTIASMEHPVTGDVTGSIGRATGLAPAHAPGLPLAILPPQAGTPGKAIPSGLQSAAESGNAAAAYEIASRYAEGRGVAPSLVQAAHWFQQAADRGLASAQYRLGSLYEKGQGVKKDLEQARRLYRAAADQGHGKAMHNLAVLYSEGIDGKPDFNQAAEWFRKAAMHGIADSQYNLGILYARGLGVEQSYAESYKWFALAAAHGDADAGHKRDEIASHLDSQALEVAKLTVKAFKVVPQPEAAMDVKAPPGGWDSLTPAAAAKPSARRSTHRKVGAL